MIERLGLAVAALALVASAAAAGAQQQQAAPPAPPEGPGLTLINERCGFCHNTGQVFAARKPAPAWAATVQSMIDRGAELDPGEQKLVTDYLAAHFGTAATPSDAATAPSANAPRPASPAH